jgi:hypothetical protein
MPVAGSLSLMSPLPATRSWRIMFICLFAAVEIYIFVARWCSRGSHVCCATVAAPLATWILRSHSAQRRRLGREIELRSRQSGSEVLSKAWTPDRTVRRSLGEGGSPVASHFFSDRENPTMFQRAEKLTNSASICQYKYLCFFLDSYSHCL